MSDATEKTKRITGDALHLEPRTPDPGRATPAGFDWVCWRCEESTTWQTSAADSQSFINEHAACWRECERDAEPIARDGLSNEK